MKEGEGTLEKLIQTLSIIMENAEYSAIISDAMREARKLDTDEERAKYFALVESFRSGLTES